jgi:hypothetical protein
MQFVSPGVKLSEFGGERFETVPYKEFGVEKRKAAQVDFSHKILITMNNPILPTPL